MENVANKQLGRYTISLCWDCKNAVSGCCWAKENKPVDGWKAKFIKAQNSKPYDTYLVINCPEFVRDAYDGGTRRNPRKIKL